MGDWGLEENCIYIISVVAECIKSSTRRDGVEVLSNKFPKTKTSKLILILSYLI